MVLQLFFYFQVNYMLYRWFHIEKEIPINCLFTQWKCTCILDFGPWKWSALNVAHMDKRPSRMQGSCQGRGAEALAFSVLPLPAALTRATLVGGIWRGPPLSQFLNQPIQG